VASKNGSLTHFDSDEADPLIPAIFIRQFIDQAFEAYRTENQGEGQRRGVVYRDGVSYGLMPRVKKQEVAAITDALQVSTEPISLTFFVAHKHGAIRVLESKGQIQNARAGTVVTEGIGPKGVAEFDLISHSTNQGSASPTRYTIIHNSPVGWKDDEIVLMTHYQTLQYPNWAGSIRIPACLMLASRLAEFSKVHLASEAAAEPFRQFLHYL
jgi:aubergine-like protein